MNKDRKLEGNTLLQVRILKKKAFQIKRRKYCISHSSFYRYVIKWNKWDMCEQIRLSCQVLLSNLQWYYLLMCHFSILMISIWSFIIHLLWWLIFSWKTFFSKTFLKINPYDIKSCCKKLFVWKVLKTLQTNSLVLHDWEVTLCNAVLDFKRNFYERFLSFCQNLSVLTFKVFKFD